MSDDWVTPQSPAPRAMSAVDELVEAYGEALKRMAAANAAEASADDQRKIIRAEQIVKCGDIPTIRAENIALASPEYKAAVRDCFNATKEAGDARGEVEHLRVRWDTWRTKTSAQKAKMQHGG